MHKELIAFNKTQRTRAQDFRAGDVVRVFRKIVEGSKERIQVFEGMIVVTRGGQSSSQMITVRKVSNGVGVEIIVPVQSPQIEKIELVKRAKVRRANIGYIRTKPSKKLRFKFTDAQDLEKKKEENVEENADKASDDADNLTKIEGIGPKIAQTLADAGIKTFATLAEADVAKIADIIKDVRGNHDPQTWPQQAALARDGKWDELSQWQDELKGGKES